MRTLISISVMTVVGVCLALYVVFKFPLARAYSHKLGFCNARAAYCFNEVNTKFMYLNTSGLHEENDTVAFIQAGKKMPLVVSFHTWNGDFLQFDPMAQKIVDLGYSYLRPNLKAVRTTKAGCLSVELMSRVDRAIDWALGFESVDENKIILLGASGGGYHALGYAAKGTHSISHVFSWVPIVDLYDWYWQSLSRGKKYSSDVLDCSGGTINIDLLKNKSPLYMPPYRANSVSVYAGIHDQSVPASHGINYYNNFANQDDRLSETEVRRLLTRAYSPSTEVLDGKEVLLHKASNGFELTIFNGGHEMLEDIALQDLSSVTLTNYD